MKLTKEIVDRLLAANTKNRKVNIDHVRSLARAMQIGNFRSNNGQTIVVNESWTRLLDGQHRLLAMKMSGVYGLEMLVVTIPDCEAESTFKTIDLTKNARSAAQVITLEGGFPNADRVVPIISAMLRHCKHFESPSVEEIETYYKKYENLITRMHVNQKCAISNKRAPASFWAGAMNAILITGRENEIIERCHRILQGISTTVCDGAMISLLIPKYGTRANGKSSRSSFFLFTKAFIHPELKFLKLVENENLDRLRFVNF